MHRTDHAGGTQELNVDLLKGRAAEAFVENVLEQAGYRVSRVGRESHVQQMLKTGRSQFTPDFLAWRPAGRSPEGGPPLHRLLCVEVQYRANVGAFLRLNGPDVLSLVDGRWPDLQVVIVTDNPEPGRSCFQLLALPARVETPLATVDLHTGSALGIDRSVCDEYEHVIRHTFRRLGEHSLEDALTRTPPMTRDVRALLPQPAPGVSLA